MTSIAAAVSRGQTVDVVPVGGDTTSPTAPALAYAANDKFATGTEAERRGIGSPDRLVTGVLAHVADGSPVVIGTSTYPADVVLATMVQAVLTTVEAEQGGDPAQLTITYPTHWSDDQITALAEALRPAAPGGVLRRIPDAVAIAVDYLAGPSPAHGGAGGGGSRPPSRSRWPTSPAIRWPTGRRSASSTSEPPPLKPRWSAAAAASSFSSAGRSSTEPSAAARSAAPSSFSSAGRSSTERSAATSSTTPCCSTSTAASVAPSPS